MNDFLILKINETWNGEWSILFSILYYLNFCNIEYIFYRFVHMVYIFTLNVHVFFEHVIKNNKNSKTLMEI
jgi:hypothetical protein